MVRTKQKAGLGDKQPESPPEELEPTLAQVQEKTRIERGKGDLAAIQGNEVEEYEEKPNVMDTTWQMYAGNDFFRRCKPDEGIVLFLDKFFLVAGKDQTTAIALPPDGELSRQLIDDHWMNNLHLLPVLGPLSRDGEYVAPVTGDPWATNHPGVRVHPEWLWRFNDPTWGVGAGCYSQGFDKGMEGFAIYGENIFVAGSDKGGYEAVFLPKDPSHRYRVMQAHWWKMLPTMPILGEMSRPLARPPGYTKRLGLNRMRGAPFA